MATTAASNATARKPSTGRVVDRRVPSMEVVPWRTLVAESDAWERLALEASEPNPFLESWHLLPSLEAYDPQGDLRVLRFEHDGRLAGVLPLVRKARYYGKPLPHLANWQHDNTFLGTPLVAGGCESEFWRAALDWADRNARSSLFFHLADLGLDGPVVGALAKVVAAQGREAWVVQREDRALLSSTLDAEQYRAAALSAGKRKDLRRRMNRLGELGEVRFVWQDDDAGVDLWCEQFLALEMSGWKGKAGSAMGQDAAKRSIFTQGLAGAARRGRLLRLSLHLNGEPIAMLSTFLTPPGAFGYKTAFDERFGRHAPGVLLENEFLSALDQGRFLWCDGCAAARDSIINGIWRERRSVGKVSIAVGGALRRRIFGQLVRREKGAIPMGDVA